MPSTVFIVGVGPGLGESLAKTFHDANYNVGLIARSHDKLSVISDNLGNKRVCYSVCDCTNVDAFKTSLRFLCNELGSPSVAIYNAAALTMDNALQVNPHTLLNNLDVNIVSALNFVQTLISLFPNSDTPNHILFTGGILAHSPSKDFFTLSLGKQALFTLFRLLLDDLYLLNILLTYFTISTLIGSNGMHPDLIASRYLDAVLSRQAGEIVFP